MKKNLLKSLIGLLILSPFSQVIAQDVITFDVNSKKQLIKSLETWSEVIMYHPTMSPTPSDLVIDLNSHNFTMSLKPDIEQVNDNADPYDTDFSKFNVNQGGNSGINMAAYFPYIREYKRLRDSMRAVNPALKPFTLNLRPGYYDRYVNSWLKSTAPGTAQVDSTKYAEYAENIYAQVKSYKDNTGVDVSYIDPLVCSAGTNITPSNLCKLIGTLGSYLETRGFTPALSIGAGLRLTETYSNQALLFNYITAVFKDPIAKKYVKNVNVDYDLIYGAASDAFFNRMADTSKKYGFEITTELSFSNAGTNSWSWAGNGMKIATNLPKMLNTAKANKVMLVYHSNFEIAFQVSMVFDTIGNSVASLDDPRRKTTARKTETYYILRHLFKHTNPGSSYVLTSSSTNANILQTVVYDTITQKTTVFLVNKGSSSYTAKLSYGTYNPGLYDVYRCSATEIDVRLASINGTDNIVLPAQSATILTTDNVTPDTQIPSVPTGLNSSNITPYGCTLSWTASTDNIGVTGYEVFKDGVSAGSTNTNSINVTGLTCNTSYSLTVRARDAVPNWSAQSTALNVITSICDGTAPSIPTGLSATAIAHSSFTLSWTPSTDNVGVVSYEVFKDGVSAGSTTTNSINVTGLSSVTTYSMTVIAKDEAGNASAASIGIDVTTVIAPLTTTLTTIADAYVRGGAYATNNFGTDTVLIEKTSSLSADYTRVSYLKFDISGITGTVNSAVLQLYVRTIETAGVLPQTLRLVNDDSWGETTITYNNQPTNLGAVISTYNVSSLGLVNIDITSALLGETDGTLSLKIESTLNNAVTYRSKEASQTKPTIVITYNSSTDTQAPSAPTGLSSSGITQTTFTLSWTASTDDVGVQSYEVYKNGVSIGTTASTSLSVTGLTCGASYAMTVRARDAAANWSAQSAAQNVTTSACPDIQAPSVPTDLDSSLVTQTSFTLSWTASTDNVGVVSYEVFVNGTSVGTTTGTSKAVSGLICDSTYSMTVIAKDAAGNTSIASEGMNITTSDCLISSALHPTADANLRVYPNPADKVINLAFLSETDDIAKIKVIDISGKEVISHTEPVVSGMNNLQLPVNQLCNGMYFINLTSGTKSITKKFVVNK